MDVRLRKRADHQLAPYIHVETLGLDCTDPTTIAVKVRMWRGQNQMTDPQLAVLSDQVSFTSWRNRSYCGEFLIWVAIVTILSERAHAPYHDSHSIGGDVHLLRHCSEISGHPAYEPSLIR